MGIPIYLQLVCKLSSKSEVVCKSVKISLIGMTEINSMKIWSPSSIHKFDNFCCCTSNSALLLTISSSYKEIIIIERQTAVLANSDAQIIAHRQNAWSASWGMLHMHFFLLDRGIILNNHRVIGIATNASVVLNCALELHLPKDDSRGRTYLWKR